MSERKTVINPNLHPPSGFRFKDSDKVVHVGRTLDALVRSVFQYRARLSRPPGDPEREITEQICNRYPQICLKAKPTYDTKTLASVVARGIRAAATSSVRLQTVSQERADKRAKVCDDCPMCVNWVDGCKPCEVSARKLIDCVIGSNLAPPLVSGKACLLSREDLGLRVNLVSNEPCLAQPDNCWRGKPSE